jgi:hypothetical protein
MTASSSRASRTRSFLIDHWPLIIVNCSLLLVGLILAAPLLQNAALCLDDAALHVYRTVALDRALHDGLLYPRWFPDLAYGYGFPFFNYREPLGYYLIELVHLLGASVPLSLNLMLAGSLIASGLTMNLWISDVFDRPAGFVAAIVYMAAPYTVLDSLARANLPEAIALALMPLILWVFRRLLLRGSRKYLALAVLSLAALLLTHNISSLIFVPVLIVYIAVVRGACSVKSEWITRYALRVTLFAFVLALALTAFFWLPALAEGQSAQLYLTHTARGNDYRFNFATVAEVFGPPDPSDPSLLNPPLRIALGWAQIGFAVLGVVLIKHLATREQRAHVIIAAVAAVIFIFMALPIALPVWDTLPLIRFVQFPWRFVGRAILPMSLLAGAATYSTVRIAYSVSRNSRTSLVTRFSLIAIFTLPVLLSVTSLLYPRICAAATALTITDVFAYEHATGNIGVDPLGAYLPVTVKERPLGSPLEEQYAAQAVIQRLDRSTLPGGTQISTERYSPNRAEIEIATPQAFRATYLTFTFPGWTVKLDGQPASIIPSDPTGLITFEVPAGQHTIAVSFEDTPSRTLANMISLAALIVFAVVLVRGINPAAGTAKPDTCFAVPCKSGSGFIFPPASFIFVPLLFLLLKVLLVDPRLTPLRQADLQNGTLSNVAQATSIDFGDQLRLLGYRLTPEQSPSGETVRVDLYWRALRPLDKNYQTTVGLVDANGEVWSPKTLDRPRDYQDYPATHTWPTDAYVVDSFELPINPGTPPGGYQIFAEVFEHGTQLPLPAQASASRPVSRPAAAIIGPLAVTHAARTFDATQLGIYNFKANQLLAPGIKLIGANRDRSDVLAGDSVLLTLFWQAALEPTVQKLGQDYTATVELVNDQNQVIATHDFPLGAGRYPTSHWRATEQVIDLDRVRVPVDLASGSYRWRVSIGGGEPIELGDLHVNAPERSFAMPPIANPVNQTLNDQATLLGYDVAGCGKQAAECRVKLWWQAEQDIPESYKVFVHLLDANGVPRAQADVIPQNGARPTWSWLPGEIIADEITLQLPADLPAGHYRLTTGLYNELNGTRLTLPDGKNAIELAAVEIGP